MNSTFKALFVAGIITSVSFVACKKDDPGPSTCVFATELQDESNALSAAATAYGNDPTPANCQTFIAAYEDYLEEAERLIPCAQAAGQGAQLQAAINDAQLQLDAIQC